MKRLVEDRSRAEAGRPLARVEIPERGHDDHDRLRELGTEQRKRCQAVDLGHIDVADDQKWLGERSGAVEGVEALEQRDSIGGRVNAETYALEPYGHEAASSIVVFGDDRQRARTNQ